MGLFTNDKVNIDLTINGNPDIAELNKTQREVNDLTAKLKELKKAKQEDSEEFKKFNAQLTESSAKMQEQRDKLGLYGKTIAQLRNEAKDLAKVINTQLTPGTEEYIKKNEKLNEINNRLAELKNKTKAVVTEQEELSKKSSGFLDTLKGIGIAVLAAFSIEAIKSFLVGVDQSSRQINKLRNEIQQLTGVSGSVLDDTTSRIIALSGQYEKEYKEVLIAANSFSENFGISLDESISLIEAGFIKGADSTGEFLDKIREYPAFFKNAGYSAEEFIKIATQEVKGGIYSDKLLDSVKEINLRLSELSATQQTALSGAFGQGFTDEFIKKISTGQITIKEGLKLIQEQADKSGLSVTQLQTLTADLGGGPVEDINGLANAFKQLEAAEKINIEAVSEYEKQQKQALELDKEVARAKQDIAKELYGNQTGFAKLQKQLEAGFYKALLQIILIFKDIFDFANKAFAPLGKSIQTITDLFGAAGVKIDFVKLIVSNLFRTLELGIKAWSLAFNASFLIFNTIAAFIGGFVEKWEEGFVPAIRNAWSKMTIALGDNFQTFVDGAISLLDTLTFGLSTYLGLVSQAKNESESIQGDSIFTSTFKKINEEVTKPKEEKKQGGGGGSISDNQIAANQKAADDAKALAQQNAKDQADAEKELQDLRIASIQEASEREIAELNLKFERELEAFKGSAEQKAEFEKLKEEEKNLAIQEITKSGLDEKLRLMDEAQNTAIQLQNQGFEEQKRIETESFTASNQNLLAQLAAGKISRTQFDEALIQSKLDLELRLSEIEYEARQAELQAEIEYNQQKLDQNLLDEENKAIVLADIKTAETEMKDLEVQNNIDRFEREKEAFFKAEQEKTLKVKTEEEQKKQIRQAITGFAKGLITDLGAADSQRIADQISDLQRQKDIEIKAAGDNKEKVAEINARYESKERALKVKKAEQDKQNALFSAFINIAEGITKAISLGGGTPLGFVLASIVAAQGFIQIANIQKQTPKFGKGGGVRKTASDIIDMRLGNISGPSHENGGVVIEAEGGEFITRKSATSLNRDVLETINSNPDIRYRLQEVDTTPDVGNIVSARAKSQYSTFESGGGVATDNTPSRASNTEATDFSALVEIIYTLSQQVEKLVNKIDEKSDTFKKSAVVLQDIKDAEKLDAEIKKFNNA